MFQRRPMTELRPEPGPFRRRQFRRRTGLQKRDQSPHHPGREPTTGTATFGHPVDITVLDDPPASDTARRERAANDELVHPLAADPQPNRGLTQRHLHHPTPVRTALAARRRTGNVCVITVLRTGGGFGQSPGPATASGTTQTMECGL